MNKFLDFAFEVKSIDAEQGIIEGYASTFGNMDQGFDIVDRGAFAKTLRENRGRVPILADHDPRRQIGWNLVAQEDDRGLYVKGQLDVKENQLARERFSLVKQALELDVKYGFSIGYSTIKAEPDPTNVSIRRLKELKLWEYSLVTFPMNTEAAVTAAKHWASGPSIEENLERFVAAMKGSGYDESQILSALGSRAATRKNEPDKKTVHSVLQQLEKLNNMIATA
jgi:HK97 family phage prohead protease